MESHDLVGRKKRSKIPRLVIHLQTPGNARDHGTGSGRQSRQGQGRPNSFTMQSLPNHGLPISTPRVHDRNGIGFAPRAFHSAAASAFAELPNIASVVRIPKISKTRGRRCRDSAHPHKKNWTPSQSTPASDNETVAGHRMQPTNSPSVERSPQPNGMSGLRGSPAKPARWLSTCPPGVQIPGSNKSRQLSISESTIVTSFAGGLGIAATWMSRCS